MKWIAIVIFLLLFLVLIATLFVLLRRWLYNAIDRRIARFQNGLLEKHLEEIQEMYRQVRGWRHDYRNHIQNMKIQLAEGNYSGLGNYLAQLADDLASVDTIIKTGNVMADAVLNSKLNTAKKLHILFNVKANIPSGLPISDVELCSLLGNMLDNCIEACAALPEAERFIRIYIGKFKGHLYFSFQNSAGVLRKVKGKYLSSKTGEHGYGLFRIDRIAMKYGGYVNRQNEEGIFATELMIPLEPH